MRYGRTPVPIPAVRLRPRRGRFAGDGGVRHLDDA